MTKRKSTGKRKSTKKMKTDGGNTSQEESFTDVDSQESFVGDVSSQEENVDSKSAINVIAGEKPMENQTASCDVSKSESTVDESLKSVGIQSFNPIDLSLTENLTGLLEANTSIPVGMSLMDEMQQDVSNVNGNETDGKEPVESIADTVNEATTDVLSTKDQENPVKDIPMSSDVDKTPLDTSIKEDVKPEGDISMCEGDLTDSQLCHEIEQNASKRISELDVMLNKENLGLPNASDAMKRLISEVSSLNQIVMNASKELAMMKKQRMNSAWNKKTKH